MRDLYALLESFKINEPMDYCEEFNCIKSILEYCNEDVKPFHKAHFRGGTACYLITIYLTSIY